MKEETCQSIVGDAPSADTNGTNDKTTSQNSKTESSAPSAEPSKESEPSTPEPASALWVPGGPVPTSGKLLAVPTDNKQTRWEKFKGFLSGNRLKPNPLLLSPEAKIIGTFTVHINGYIDDGIAVTDDPKNCRAFQVLAIQLTRQTFRVSAQPVDKRKPSWWTTGYSQLVMDFLEQKRQAFMQLNERKLRASGQQISMESQAPQQGVKKGS
jgi:hypothetical protein